MNANSRRITQSPVFQGADEQIAYSLTTTPWGSSPSSVAVALYSVSGETFTDVSSTKLSGSASANGDVITTPKVIGLTEGTLYRLEIKFTCSGNVYEAFCDIVAQR